MWRIYSNPDPHEKHISQKYCSIYSSCLTEILVYIFKIYILLSFLLEFPINRKNNYVHVLYSSRLKPIIAHNLNQVCVNIIGIDENIADKNVGNLSTVKYH
jgi:hypothetical protein